MRSLAGQADQAALAPEIAAHLATLEGPVLLVDDLTDAGWTLTVASALLRDAGASAVLLLVLASRT